MSTRVLAAVLAGSFLFAGAVVTTGAAAAEEVTVDMQRLSPKGPAGSLGSIVLTETAEGLAVTMNIKDLPPGPNRFFKLEDGNCDTTSTAVVSADLQEFNIGINEDGSEPLKLKKVLTGVTLADLKGKALVIDRGGQLAAYQPMVQGVPLRVACGVVN